MYKYLLALFVPLFFFSFGYGQELPTADLSVSQTHSAGPYLPDNLVTFTIRATNLGPGNAGEVQVTDQLPAELVFVSASATVGSYQEAGGVFTIGTLDAGATAELTLVARINAPPGTTLRNTASIKGAANDPAPANNVAHADITVVPVPETYIDLSISKSITPAPPYHYQSGENITYTLVTTNTGNAAATGVTLTDVLPANLTFVNTPDKPNRYNPATGLYSIGSLAPGAIDILTIVATINTSGPIVNTATVAAGSGNPIDRDNKNNMAIREICVRPDQPTRLEINGSDLTRQVCSGQEVEFKVPVVSGATQYEYVFPAGFSVVRQQGSIIRVIPGQQAGEVSITAINSCGVSVPLKVPVAVSVLPPVPGEITGPLTPCSGTEVVYSIAPVADAAAYSWTLPQGWTIISGETTTAVTVRVGTGAGDVVVKAANVCGGGSTRQLAVRPVLTPAIPVITDNSSACSGLRYSVAPVAGAAFTWTVPSGWTIASGQGTATILVKAPDSKATGLVSVVAQQGSCAAPPATYQAIASVGDGLLDLPNAFSPNGDGQNDTYVIGNLDKYPDNDILIINRWGNQVFKQVNYQNNWSARELNDGTYFYVLRVKACNEEQKIYRGYITIAR